MNEKIIKINEKEIKLLHLCFRSGNCSFDRRLLPLQKRIEKYLYDSLTIEELEDLEKGVN